MDAKAIVERAKELQGFRHDQDLAEWLNVSRPTLASWKRRGSIPAKYLFEMIKGTEASIDWLVEGKDREFTDDYGMYKGKQLIDPDVLWIALLLYRLEMSGGGESHRKIAEALRDDENLLACHIFLGNFITLVNAAKQKWQKSGIVKEEDVYKAIATEFGIAFFDFPPAPWWE